MAKLPQTRSVKELLKQGQDKGYESLTHKEQDTILNFLKNDKPDIDMGGSKSDKADRIHTTLLWLEEKNREQEEAKQAEKQAAKQTKPVAHKPPQVEVPQKVKDDFNEAYRELGDLVSESTLTRRIKRATLTLKRTATLFK